MVTTGGKGESARQFVFQSAKDVNKVPRCLLISQPFGRIEAATLGLNLREAPVVAPATAEELPEVKGAFGKWTTTILTVANQS